MVDLEDQRQLKYLVFHRFISRQLNDLQKDSQRQRKLRVRKNKQHVLSAEYLKW